MKSLALATLFLTALTTSATVIYDPTTQTFKCLADGTFCAGDSTKTDVLVTCKGGVGVVTDCCATLSDQSAVCWTSSTAAGDAGCAVNGMVHPASGTPFKIPVGNGTTPGGKPAVISNADKPCNCSKPVNGTSSKPPPGPGPFPPPLPPMPVPSPGPKGTPVNPVIPPPSSVSPPCSSGTGVKPSSKPGPTYTSSTLPASWSPTPTVSVSPTKFSGAASMPTGIPAAVAAAAGLAALLI